MRFFNDNGDGDNQSAIILNYDLQVDNDHDANDDNHDDDNGRDDITMIIIPMITRKLILK